MSYIEPRLKLLEEYSLYDNTYGKRNSDNYVLGEHVIYSWSAHSHLTFHGGTTFPTVVPLP